MSISLSFNEFYDAAQKYACIPIWTDRLADWITPVGAYIRLNSASRNAYLLESAPSGNAWSGRYSFIGLEVETVYSGVNSVFTLHKRNEQSSTHFSDSLGDFLRSVLKLNGQVYSDEQLPPFWAGAVGFSRIGTTKLNFQISDPCNTTLPDFLFMKAGASVIFDHVKRSLKIVVPVVVEHQKNVSIRHLYDEAVELISWVVQQLEQPIPQAILQIDPTPISSEVSPKKEKFISSNNSRLWQPNAGSTKLACYLQLHSSRFSNSSLDLYRALRITAPSENMFYLKCGDIAIVGASPEMHFRVRRGLLTSRLVTFYQADLQGSLRLHEAIGQEQLKLMNILATDSLVLDPPMHVQTGLQSHFVSVIEGRLHEMFDGFSALDKLIPSASLRTVPREAITAYPVDLETLFRGSMGYFDIHSDSEMCTLRRTFVVCNQTVSFAVPQYFLEGREVDSKTEAAEFHLMQSVIDLANTF